MTGEVDIESLTIDQYLMMTQGNQASGMDKSKFGRMVGKDTEEMTITEYIEYEAEMKRQRNARSYFPKKYGDMYINFLHHNKSRVSEYPHHSDDLKINANYGLPPLLLCFKPVQPYTEYWNEPLKEDTIYISNEVSKAGEQRVINHTDGDKPFTPKPQPDDEEL
ncbi:hypothetical protein Tco_1422818, partial [Tanacetum coccineum]